jgi:hypothetical protein
MIVKLRSTSLPLGADIGHESVSLVRTDVARGGFTLREAGSLQVPAATESDADLTVAETIRAILRTFSTRERRCIVAAPPGDVVHRIFRLPPGMGRREAERAAALEADSLAPWPPAERVLALDPIPGLAGDMLLAVARRNAIDRLVGIAKAGGLTVVAVDLPICAWRRAVPDADAVLDLTRERAELIVFGESGGAAQLFAPRLIDERLALNVRTFLVEARRDGIADVRRLSILATSDRYASLQSRLRDDGYAIAPVRFGEAESPTWAFAYGLATWSVAPLGLQPS